MVTSFAQVLAHYHIELMQQTKVVTYLHIHEAMHRAADSWWSLRIVSGIDESEAFK